MSLLNGAKFREHGDEARRLFVEQGHTIPEISARLGVSEVTLRKWRDANQWEEIRATHVASAPAVAPRLKSIIAALVKEADEVAARGELGERLLSITDALSKLHALLRTMDKSVDFLAVAADVLGTVMDVLARRDARLAREFDRHMAEINQALIEKFKELQRR